MVVHDKLIILIGGKVEERMRDILFYSNTKHKKLITFDNLEKFNEILIVDTPDIKLYSCF